MFSGNQGDLLPGLGYIRGVRLVQPELVCELKAVSETVHKRQKNIFNCFGRHVLDADAGLNFFIQGKVLKTAIQN